MSMVYITGPGRDLQITSRTCIQLYTKDGVLQEYIFYWFE